MTYRIEYFTSVQRYCVIAVRKDGYFNIVAGYAKKQQALSHLQRIAAEVQNAS